MRFKSNYKNLFSIVFALFTLIFSYTNLTYANEISDKTRLIVTYRPKVNFLNASNLNTENNKTHFELTLESVLKKLEKPIKIKFNKNKIIKPSQTKIAYIEKELQELDSYIVQVSSDKLADELQILLEEEPGVVKITKDFEVFLPESFEDEKFFATSFITCDPSPKCTSGTIACDSGIPSCPDSKLPLCLFIEPFETISAGCLGGDRFTTHDVFCDNGFGPPQPLPDDPYNSENWHTIKTGLIQHWNNTCNCPVEILQKNCNVLDHPELCKVGSSDVVIAVLDNGFAIGAQPGTTGHHDLAGRWDLDISRSTIIGDNPLNYDSSDETSVEVFYDHGTAVALAAGANANNKTSHAGVDWNSRLWAVRIGKGRSAFLSSILAGFDYVLSKIEEKNIKHFFVNLSYGSLDCNKSLAKAVNDHAGKAVKDHGGLITVSAGNSGCLQDFGDIAPEIIVVGATVADTNCSKVSVAGYSNFGSSTDIFSPSGFVLDNRNIKIENYALSKQTIHGTSFAAPALAGFGALLWSINPALSPLEIEKVLKVSSINSFDLFQSDSTSKNKILQSGSSQIKIDDAVSLMPEILSTTVTTIPDINEIVVFPNTRSVFDVRVTNEDLQKELNLEGFNLPEGASFEVKTGLGSLSQTFQWIPLQTQVNQKYHVLFLVKNSAKKVIGFKKIVFNVQEKPNNKSPVAKAGEDKTVKEGDLVTLDGTGSYDPDGEGLSFTWSQVTNSAPKVSLSNPNMAVATFTAPDVSGEVTFTFELRVKDTIGDESRDFVNIIVRNNNTPPIVNAGIGKTVRPKELIEFSDATASDPDGDKLTYSWDVINPPIFVTRINSAELNTAGFIAHETNKGIVDVQFQLTVSDGISNVSDTVTYMVKNFSPTADAGSDRNSFRGAYVGIGGINNFDPDGDSLSFSWTQVKGSPIPLLSPNHRYPIIRIPEDFLGSEAVFRLTVDDDLGGIATDEVSIFVKN